MQGSMIRKSKKDALIDAAIQSYAENGEQGLTTKNLARVAGCSEALIYRHFKSKDDLLRECYFRLHTRANESLGSFSLPETDDITELVEACRQYYIRVFRFFVSAGYESLFYFWFRMSDSFTEYLSENPKQFSAIYLTSFMDVVEKLRVKFDLRIPADYYKTYLVFVMGIFVEQVVKGKMPDSDETYDVIADLVFGGLIKTLPEEIQGRALVGNR